MNQSVLLDAEVGSMNDVVEMIVNQPVYNYLTEDQKEKVRSRRNFPIRMQLRISVYPLYLSLVVN